MVEQTKKMDYRKGSSKWEVLKEWLLKAEGWRRHEDKVADSVTNVSDVVGGVDPEPRPGPSPGIQTSDGLPGGVKGRPVSAVFNTPLTLTLALQGRKESPLEFMALWSL